jgi:signal transduction histidine kinase/ActR/RegA family two-component response regulator
VRLSALFPRSFSLSAQLLLTFVVLVGASVIALTGVSYDGSVENLETMARRDAAAAARARADLVSQLLTLRQRRALGFLRSVDSLCNEVAGGKVFSWAEDCVRTMVRDFRTTEDANGVMLAYAGRRLAREGNISDVGAASAEHPWSRVGDVPVDMSYVLQVTDSGAVLTVEYNSSAVLAVFDDVESDAPAEAMLFDGMGQRLAPSLPVDPATQAAAPAGSCTTAHNLPGEPIVTAGGRRVMRQLYPMESLPGACVVASIDYDEQVLKPAAQLRRDLFIQGSAFVLVGMLLSLAAARRIAAPVRRLADAARALQHGQFGATIPTGGPSEVQALGRAFAAMSNDLADLLAREQAGRREAEAANRSKDQFLAMLSHELRTPLTAVLGWAHTLRVAAADGERVQRAAAAIERNAESQRRLIEDLLDVAGIAAGRVRMSPSHIVIDPVVEAALDAVAPQAEEKHIQVRTRFETKGLTVYADPQRLQQIVWNLVWNAVKYTPENGRVDVRVRTSGRLAELIVSDTGVGIDPEFLPHVFGWFRQADSGRIPDHGGIGLGLALVRQLVELHGGSVRAESPGVNKGSTFVVTLPLHADDVPSDGPIHEAPAISLASLRVLVVDDDPGSREAIRVLLEQVGADVATASSAADARRFLRRERADVLVSDIAMAHESGYTLMQTLRAEGLRIPGIALTGYARREDADRAYASGFDVHLPKPVDPEVLVSVLAAVVRREANG